MIRLTSLMGNSQRLDGGAMFGNAPKAVWQRWVDVDDDNRIALSCRALLVQIDNKNILFETGIGQFFDPELRARYGVVEDRHVLLDSLKQHDMTDQDIDFVVLSHLHFDHAGGLLSAWQPDRAPSLLFPRAQFVVGKSALARALNPHPRDRASFIPELNHLLLQSGRLMEVDGEYCPALGSCFRFTVSDGHTPGMLVSEIVTPKASVYFCADLIPAAPWVHLPITMGYDRFPEHLIDEKDKLLDTAVNNEGFLFFTHDPDVALANVIRNDRGRYEVSNPVASLNDWSGQ